jgi:2-dehydro-3-deoxygluconokinase
MPVFIAASSFGYEAAAKGQSFLVHIAKLSGASGIEIRREMLEDRVVQRLSDNRVQPLPEGFMQLRQLRDEVRRYKLTAAYSAPIGMWLPEGELNARGLSVVLQEAQELGARYVKVSLGQYDTEKSALDDLKKLLSGCISNPGTADLPIRLMVENDQTAHGGNAGILKRFFEQCAGEGIPVRMTFDIGNWYWTGECPVQAAKLLAEHVIYIHCKQVQAGDDGWTTVPLSGEPGMEWRKVLSFFPRQLPRVIEFPITEVPLETATGKYVRLLSEA